MTRWRGHFDHIWPGWTAEAVSWQRARTFLGQALPLAASMSFEEWQIQAITIMAGHLGKVAVAAHSGMLEIFFFLSSVEMAIMAATTVRVAYQDGETGALRYARRTGADDWNVITLRGDEMPSTGSYGFYTDQTLDPALANPLISTFRYLLQGPPGNGLEIISPP